jgi:uncharacterized protein YeaO (DUF488 family)
VPIRLKRVYEAPGPDDGYRLLVMRFWPRGVRKENVDEWDRGLAPSRGLLADFNARVIEWPEYAIRFLAEMSEREDSQASLASLRKHSRYTAVTLLCWCADENFCHRSLLRDVVLGS